MSFENIIGNDKIKQELEENIRNNTVSHSYLFIGQDGIGKKLFAKEFAKMELCLDDNNACDKCSSCIKFNSDNNPDFVIIKPDGNSIKISQIRDMQDNVYKKPIVSNKKVFIIDDSDNYYNDSEDLASASSRTGDHYLAAAISPLLLSAVTNEFGSEEESADISQEQGADISMKETISENSALDYYDQSSDTGFGDGGDRTDQSGFGSDGSEPLSPEPTPTPEPIDGFEYADPNGQVGDSGFTDGDETFYQTLEFDTEPYAGSGTKDDPFVYLCSSAKGYVKATGAFLNKMAGYNEDGTQVLHKGGYWYLLEFHNGDMISDYQDRKASCIGYYLT